MSQAREAKMREWRCNIFNISAKDETPLFDRKKRTDGSNNTRTIGFESITPCNDCGVRESSMKPSFQAHGGR